LQQINGDYFFIFLEKLTNDIYILFDDIRNKYFASIFMFGTIFLLVFNADFNTHMVCTMAVDNLFCFFVIISVRKENILKIEYSIFYRMTYHLAKSKFIAYKMKLILRRENIFYRLAFEFGISLIEFKKD